MGKRLSPADFPDVAFRLRAAQADLEAAKDIAGRLFHRARRAAGLSLRDVAEEAGISVAYTCEIGSSKAVTVRAADALARLIERKRTAEVSDA